VSVLEHTPAPALDSYIVRGDFSRWIADVFGDRALAKELLTLEERHRSGPRADTLSEVVNAIRGRYDLIDAEVQAAGS
jgi:hypothetical protein